MFTQIHTTSMVQEEVGGGGGGGVFDGTRLKAFY